MTKLRRATHAGSWYKEDPVELNRQLDSWLSNATEPQFGPARAIIAPHAGYYYCGDCSAHAYRQIDPRLIQRVFILGPAHQIRLSGCALTSAQTLQTPFYDLKVDQQVMKELMDTDLFETLSSRADEDEHSIEMHLPYIAKVMEERAGQFTVVPILVGSLSFEREAEYGQLLSQFLTDPKNLFVISSDFCHWGGRFHFTSFDPSFGEPWQYIKHIDRLGMDAIESLDPLAFRKYLDDYQNTICGRHPIGILLHMINAFRLRSNGWRISLKFIDYAQSSKCLSRHDSSVSYAAAVFTM